MGTILIAENILTDSDFSAATQQGAYIGQPVAGSTNTGSARPVTSGTLSDFSFSGTADSTGSATKMVDATLNVLGDNYLKGATIEFVSGENSAGTATITASSQATGAVSWSSSVNPTKVGDTFTVTRDVDDVDFAVEIEESGMMSVGDGTFKWSHDGGSNYLGRDDPYQATWLGEQTLVSGNLQSALGHAIGEAADETRLIAYLHSDNTLRLLKSSDEGVLWSESTIATGLASYAPQSIVTMPTGRVIIFLAYTNSAYLYSDDDGGTWSDIVNYGVYYSGYVNLLLNGSLGNITYNGSFYPVYHTSADGGITWSSGTLIVSAVRYGGQTVELNNGTLFAIYTDGSSNVLHASSTDGGSTWTEASGKIYDAAGSGKLWTTPNVLVDINGDLYVTATNWTDGGIYINKSVDYGTTWTATGSTLQVSSRKGTSRVKLFNGHSILAIFDDGSNNLYCVRRGVWETFSSNACPCARNVIPQNLICGTDLTWEGSYATDGDTWTFAPQYQFPMTSLITDSPSKQWKSLSDNTPITILIDMGANERHFADGVAFFGCNIRTFDFQMNATNVWTSPSVDETISFDLTSSGVVDSVSGNYIEDAALMANYKDHELVDKYIAMTSGTDNGMTWKIKDNVGDYIVLDTTSAINVGAADTFAIFNHRVAKTFTAGVYRYIRISIGSLQTADNYYQIGTMIAGKAVTLSDDWSVGYGHGTSFDNINLLQTPSKQVYAIKSGEERDTFDLTWAVSDDGIKEVVHTLKYLDGKNIALIPDSSTMTSCWPVKLYGDVGRSQVFKDEDTMTINLREIV